MQDFEEPSEPLMTSCAYCGEEIAGSVRDCGACRLSGEELTDYVKSSLPAAARSDVR